MYVLEKKTLPYIYTMYINASNNTPFYTYVSPYSLRLDIKCVTK